MKRIILLFMFLSVSVQARHIRIITPYYGSVSNRLTIQNMSDLKDTAPMCGIYFQWVNTERYQWNAFLYQVRDINQSRIFGSHFIFDYYTAGSETQKFVIGSGLDFIGIKTDGDVSPALTDFEMTNHITALYARVGWQCVLGQPLNRLDLMPWNGYEHELVRGDIAFNILPAFPGMPSVSVNDPIEDDYHYYLLGMNVRWHLYHFLEITGKYARKFSLDDRKDLNTVSAMANIFFSRHLGVSYRFKYMEVSICDNTYHMAGIAVIF